MDSINCEDKPRPCARKQWGRTMHETTLTLGDSETNYNTVMAESYCGRDSRGQPLIFSHRDPLVSSQHITTLDLSNTSVTYTPTESRDVHCPKDIVSHNVLQSYGLRNGTRNHTGWAMKEITNPSGPTLYHSSYRESHQKPSMSICHSITTMGHPVPWHSHDILTGEKKRPAGPGKHRKSTRDESVQAQRPWETDSCALRLS
ncbi:uncharacterized protein LOC116220227 [Clupea harengus]|uniref:Uncharacterized protein LOC116220227 n=1 Tax=Clupea harengus TaxID=7950 RepID=A0A6P8F8A2_CLUHA|nr:uncharacterized protein LOC116220227 [Clupea harengus]XP_042558915.1 uncharacterized protein LOC116220227 [Clupea harengus]